MGSACQSLQIASKQKQNNCGAESECNSIKRAIFEHPRQILDSVSSISSYSDQYSSRPLQTVGQIKTQDWIYLNKSDNNNQTTGRVNRSLNENSLSPLKKEYQNNFSDLSVELIADDKVQLIIPTKFKRSLIRRRVTSKVDLLNKVKQMKYQEKFKRRKT
ncbi:unnamed protein product [Paramecium primaurelia]|uniref:Uncharacterized protein n=1 Tax=Paramecium primaurelia TaxID=5886 RepID=A0A8S1KU37_PARPR|nr:unnamed protein product [Paramecium primaurelia]